ncbi:DUF350 domain-containing protein [Streptomyces somaliensis]|nr:DUF350 domain-containing protein [Streptomyces somaliensis]
MLLARPDDRRRAGHRGVHPRQRVGARARLRAAQHPAVRARRRRGDDPDLPAHRPAHAGRLGAAVLDDNGTSAHPAAWVRAAMYLGTAFMVGAAVS